MCLCNEQANKIWFLVQAVYSEIDGILLLKVNTSPDVSARSQQGTGGLSYILNVDTLSHLAMFWMSNWYLEVKAVQPAIAQGTLNQPTCGKYSKIFYIKLIFSVVFCCLQCVSIWMVCVTWQAPANYCQLL